MPPLRPSAFLSACDAAIRTAASTALLLSTLASAAQRLPYVQTTILIPELTGSQDNTSDIAYIFRATDDAGVELLSLDIAQSIDADSSLSTLSSELPFLDNASETTTFLPSVADNGTIIVQAGDCQAPDTYRVWMYTPSDLVDNTGADPGTWWELETSVSNSEGVDVGPNFLGAAISYSSVIAPDMSDPILYSFGGMCATPSADVETWQSAATYSNQMVRLSRTDGFSSYTASFPSGRGPSFPEAGFSFTPLAPSITNRSNTLIQQRTYVMLGGHTDSAFINMSRAAVWSLPEESWSFLSINEPGSHDLGTELAVKGITARAAATSVDSRSGHTATLNEDGDAVIILGGWVGTVSQPAQPQLAILSIGSTFGDWSWSVPEEQPDNGIYGHGAALLPGNVMMIYGGYEISGSTTKKRQDSGNSPRFLNLTSMAWTTSYSNPTYNTAEADQGSSQGSSHSGEMKKIGLGVGFGVGFIAILGAVIVWFCHRRRRQKQKRERDAAVRGLAQDATQFLHGDEMMESDSPWTDSSWYTGGHDPYDTGVRSLGYQSLRESRNNLGGPPPLTLNIPRKPIARTSRAGYQPAGSLSAPGRIHPIYEDDEDGHDENARDHDIAPGTPTSPTYSDPFATPTGNITSVSLPPILIPPNRAALTPSPERRHIDPEVQDWQTDIDAAEALLSQMPPKSRSAGNQGRISPTRRPSMRSARSNTPGILGDDERTGSGLSDSNRSFMSSNVSRSGSSAGRGQTLLGGPLGSGSNNNDGRVGTSGSSSSCSNNTYSTAKSNFQTLQAEGPSLLRRGERSQSHRRGSSYQQEEDEDDGLMPGSPSKSKPRRQLNWLGSIRRVFSVGGHANTSSSSGVSSRSISPIRPSSMDGYDEDPEPRSMGLSEMGGAELLRRKQGRKAWDEKEGSSEGKRPDDKVEDDWDIERAIERRLVQVMFTVPKERLRVVNADENEADYLEEEAVLVDPEKDGDIAMQKPETAPADPEKAAMYERDVPTPEPLRITKKKSSDSQKLREQENASPVLSPTLFHPPEPSTSSGPAPLASPEPARPNLPATEEVAWTPTRGRGLRIPTADDGALRLSPQPSPRADSFADDVSEPRPSLTIHTAEAVRFERPRTRVLDMVENFETRSRESSPGKPARGV
ncbi:hypothetical protein B0T11DRAFT_320459 [Plectosphaerella cucumerina]|uniref:Uncharacterized protein n=1 Tax=Plectosphaerella cucumerina TaxID=40658 RepID=A0A8K0T8U0_9PEZI|nr:hypothetical protein B0T11DRAFT_320459 [Plectosphaerella cucumerina]